MMNLKNTDNQLINKLFASDPDVVIQAIDELKEEGTAEYLPFLFNLLRTCQNEEIEKNLLNLLGAIKLEDCVPVFMDAIQLPENRVILKKIIAACWQNGLPFENYLPVFVDLIITEDWEIAFESFTLIENLINLPSRKIRDSCIEKINNSMQITVESNRYFLKELQLILQ